jgi:hypothetical protein
MSSLPGQKSGHERQLPRHKGLSARTRTTLAFPSSQARALELLCEDRMRQPQVCDHCGGRFGMVTHRWWGNKFCKRTCKGAYLRELALGRDKIRRRYGLS